MAEDIVHETSLLPRPPRRIGGKVQWQSDRLGESWSLWALMKPIARLIGQLLRNILGYVCIQLCTPGPDAYTIRAHFASPLSWLNFAAQINFKAITLKSEKGPFWDIITEAGVSRPVEDIYHQPSGLITFWTTCLWDTGATHSAITKNKSTASALGLIASGEAKIVYGSGAAITKFYTIALTLPNLPFVPEIWVTESDAALGVILGMDVICMGDFAIARCAGVRVCFAFRVWRQLILCSGLLELKDGRTTIRFAAVVLPSTNARGHWRML